MFILIRVIRRHWLRAGTCGLGIGLAAPTLAAQRSPAAPVDSIPIESGDSFRSISLERFALEMWHRVTESRRQENVLLSPASLALALSLAHAGASGATAEAFGRVMGIPEAARERYDTVAGAWLASLQGQKSVEISMANSLWASKGFPLLTTYRGRMKALYGAELSTVDLTSKRSVELINEWVSRETHTRISKLFDDPPLEVDTGLVLINALYFKGAWQVAFDSAATRPRPFRLPSGRTVQRPSMELTAGLRYARGEGYQGLRLPYGNGAFAMYVLLPDSGRGLGDIAALRDSAAWVNSLTRYGATDVHVVLPKFTMRSRLGLDEALKAAGLGVAYDPSHAEFFRMVPNDGLTRAWIVRVLQATMMQVSERGTEAAAATAVVMAATQSVPRPVHFIVDRPFLVTIRDERSGMLLFIGQIVDPQ